MHLHDIALTTIAFFSELIGTLSGFGSSTFFVPTAILIERFQMVLALTAILHSFGNISRIFLFRKHFDRKWLIRLAIPFFVFTGAGALLTTQLPVEYVKKTLGIILIVLALVFYFGKDILKHLPPQVAVLLTAVSGFSTGFVGTGGAIRGLALASLQMPKNTFVITSAAIDVGGDLLRAGIYLSSGFMDWSHWFYIPLLGVAAYAGSRIGQILLNKINQQQFERIVIGFILMSGVLTLV
ncbi:MAG: sulfite exporter TauE/SafE family protein [Bdellovibrionales bacterium]|nr:sulfite exporter TauE/SafE family protein [Bdellovibrionales bacterium]